jgi:hypothetical protein
MPATIATARHLAVLFNVTERHILRLTANGVLARRIEDGEVVKGRYDLVSAVRSYCGYLRKQAGLEALDQSTYLRLRNQKLAAEGELVRLRLQVHKKELLRSEDIEFVMTLMLTALKSRLLAIPSRTARLLIGKRSGEVYSLLASEIDLALRELSACDPNSFRPDNEEQYLARIKEVPIELALDRASSEHWLATEY